MEQWRPVVGYESTYLVSNEGRVRRVRGLAVSPRARSGYRMVRARVLSAPLVRGYPVAMLCQDGVMRQFRIHVLVAAAFIGPRPAGYDVNHKDGNKQHNRPENLEYVTEAYNNQHAYDVCGKGAKIRRGATCPWAKLTDADVLEIRRQRAAGGRVEDIAAKFGVSTGTVYGVAKRLNWKHVA